MNSKMLGILAGFLVVGIAFTGSAAAAPITGPITNDVPITESPITGPITESPITADRPITGAAATDSPITANGPITGFATADAPITL